MLIGGYRIHASSVAGASVTYNQWILFMSYTGPSSYTTGGFEIDLSNTFSSINSATVQVITQGANLPACRYEYDLNAPLAGKITVKIMKRMYDKTTSVGAVSGQPAGVTVQAASGVASSSESTHTHTITHQHGAFNTGINQNNAGGQVLLNAVGANLEQHTHQMNMSNLVATSGAGGAHNHTDNSIYQHQHGETYTATNLTSTELANTTDLSGTKFSLLVSGIRV